MRGISSVLAMICAVAGAAGPAGAQDTSAADGFAFDAGFGMMGLGVSGSYALTDRLSIRGNVNFGEYDMPDILVLASTFNGISYDYEVDLLTAGILADFYPFGGGSGLSFTAGVYHNSNEFALLSTPVVGMSIGGTPYTAAEIGTLRADTGFQDFAPYLGIGFDDDFVFGLPIYYFVRLGILFQGNPNVVMTASGGGIAANDLATEARELEDALTILEYYPVFSTGLMVRF